MIDSDVDFKGIAKETNTTERDVISIFRSLPEAIDPNELINSFYWYDSLVYQNPYKNVTNAVEIGKFQCIYFLFQDSYVCYVGQTMHPMDRISTHVSDKNKKFNGVSYYPIDCTYKQQLIIEAFNINHHSPVYNESCPTSKELLKMVAQTLV